jgi:hypothetical protein
VYVPKYLFAVLPEPDKFPKEEHDLLIGFVQNPAAVLIKPPGAELAQLFEKALKTDFSRVNLQYLQENLPEILIEEFEITQYFSMEVEDEKIRVKIEGSVYARPRRETDQPNVSSVFGSPLSSAIACVLSKTTGTPVIKVNSEADFEDKPATIEYQLLRNRKVSVL